MKTENNEISTCLNTSHPDEKKLGAEGLSQVLIAADNLMNSDCKEQAYEAIKKHEDEFEEYLDGLPVRAKLLLGDAYHFGYDLRNSEKWYLRAVEMGYDDYNFWEHLGHIFLLTGKNRQAMGYFDKMLHEEIFKIQALSNYVYRRHFDPEVSREELYSYHKEWGRIVSETISVRKSDFELKRSGKIRVGYVSPDFRRHSVAFFIAPLIANHDRQRFEVFGYGNVKSPDDITERFSSVFDSYRDIYDLNDDEAADMIINDKIDILVDLAGHTAGKRLLLFAMKPAPIQVIYLGYPNTTGLFTMDYRLTDAISEGDHCEEFHTEKPVFLDGGFLCFSMFGAMPEISELAAKNNGYITFGSFQNNAKINPYTIGLWCKVLKALKNSRMILKLKHGDNEYLKENFQRMFEANGVSSDRLDFYNYLPDIEHYKLYNKIDISLDAFPYNGTTSICEAMWMGVPVVSLVGDHHMSRVGASLLTKVGLEYFAAKTEDEYVAKAAALGSNIESLAKIRASMRERMLNSGLCDGNRFAGVVEKAYEQMVAEWYETKS